MSTNQVSSKRGVELLNLVLDVVTTQIKDHVIVVDETTGEEVKAYTATPALLTFAGKLLKDSNITMQDDDTESKLSAVEKALEERKKGRALASVSYLHPEAVND